MPFRPRPETARQLAVLCDLYGTRQTVITIAIDRMYHQEAPGMSEQTIYRITSESDSYGPDCANPMACAEAVQNELTKYADERGYQIEFEIVDETVSFGNKSKGNAELIAELNEQVELNWFDWIPGSAFV